jgi:TMEM175 potassium channel family protein
MKVPAGSDFAALLSSLPIFLAYALSYVNVGIFWNNRRSGKRDEYFTH